MVDVDFRGGDGVGALVCVQGGNFGVVAAVVVTPVGATPIVVFQIAWDTTSALYEFFVVFLFIVLGLGLILGPTRRRFCSVGVIVVLFLSAGLDGAAVALFACIVGFFLVGFFLLGSLSVVIFVVVFIFVCGGGGVIIKFDSCGWLSSSCVSTVIIVGMYFLVSL